MAKSDLASITTQIHSLLKDLESSDRHRVLHASMTLLDDMYDPGPIRGTGPSSGSAHAGGGAAGLGGRGAPAAGVVTAVEFFAQKDPRNKVEELAVAAKYRELTEEADSHTKEQLAATFKAARRNFDATHFARDMANAKTAKIFNLGKDNSLSYAGQKFVDALPDREQASAARSRRGKKKRIAPAKEKA